MISANVMLNHMENPERNQNKVLKDIPQIFIILCGYFYVDKYISADFFIFGSVLASILYLVRANLKDLSSIIHIAMTTGTTLPIKPFNQ